jgi:hypothetical protein
MEMRAFRIEEYLCIADRVPDRRLCTLVLRVCVFVWSVSRRFLIAIIIIFMT